jgi:DNA-binding NtrC family response regulator
MIATSAACISVDPRLAVVIDDDDEVQRIIATTVTALGMTVQSFEAAKEAFAAIDLSHPAIVFLDVALLRSDAIDVLRGLGERHYGGVVQLMSGGRASLLEAVARIGVRHGLRLPAPLGKPVTREAIAQVVATLPSPGIVASADCETAPQVPAADAR